MSRLTPLEVADLNPEQKELYARVGRNRARIMGPYYVWMRTPPIADAASKLIASVRENGKLENKLYELIVLTVARKASASYAWAVHEPIARSVGLEPAVIEAIHAGKKPSFSRPEDALVHEAVSTLLETTRLPDATYQAMVKQFGVELTIEIVTIVGLYVMIGTVLNTFEVPTPNGETPFA